jgi:acyl-CoA thioester hydrolase
MLPVVRMVVKYYRPVAYDELITIRTILRTMPTAKITFQYEIYNQAGELINEAEVQLVFTHYLNRKPVRPPKNLIDALQPFFATTAKS